MKDEGIQSEQMLDASTSAYGSLHMLYLIFYLFITVLIAVCDSIYLFIYCLPRISVSWNVSVLRNEW